MDKKYSREEFAAKLGANGDPKLNAAADFAARLLASPVGDSVARIVLFGSVARGEARPESDVDVMVFGFAPPKTLMKAASQASWEATVEWGESVAQLTYSLDDLLQPRSYLLYNALKRGREIYSMDETEIRHQEAVRLRNKAERHLTQAQRTLTQGNFELAIVGAYTAAELTAKALIMLKPNVELPSTHGGMIRMLSREYIQTGEAPESWGHMLSEKLELRSRALYDTLIEMTADDAQSVIDLAQEMMGFLEAKLKALSSTTSE